MPVYRTYVEPGVEGEIDDQDRGMLDDAELPSRIREAIVAPDDAADEAFAVRFQQTTGAIMAKGVEDTVLYRYSRLAALNEVGSDPARWNRTAQEVHAANLQRHERFPRGLLPTQTHDTKRSGDVRARIGALASIAGDWRDHVMKWREMNRDLRWAGAPNGDEEYLIYQTLVGAWPIEPERLRDYMTEAMREAHVDTGWAEPDVDHEAGVMAYIDGLYASEGFVGDLELFVDRAAPIGEIAALGQALRKLTAPGVPDFYQGDELWNLALVDPDNRRPVDWGLRERLLADVAGGAAPRRETAKMHLIHRALALRARRPGAFAGAYLPLASGDAGFAYARGAVVLAATPTRPDGATSVVTIPCQLHGAWRSVLTGDDHALGTEVTLGELAGTFPVALLERVVDFAD